MAVGEASLTLVFAPVAPLPITGVCAAAFSCNTPAFTVYCQGIVGGL